LYPVPASSSLWPALEAPAEMVGRARTFSGRSASCPRFLCKAAHPCDLCAVLLGSLLYFMYVMLFRVTDSGTGKLDVWIPSSASCR
jgi:hypothetical protein